MIKKREGEFGENSKFRMCAQAFFLMYNKLNEQQDARPKNSDNGDSEIFICFLLLFFFLFSSTFVFFSSFTGVQYGIYFWLAPKEIECLFYLNSNNKTSPFFLHSIRNQTQTMRWQNCISSMTLQVETLPHLPEKSVESLLFFYGVTQRSAQSQTSSTSSFILLLFFLENDSFHSSRSLKRR